MIFVDLLEVAPAKSPASTSTVSKPRRRASSAQPAPVAPPPITQTSKDSLPMVRSISSRLLMVSPRAPTFRFVQARLQSAPGSQIPLEGGDVDNLSCPSSSPVTLAGADQRLDDAEE